MQERDEMRGEEFRVPTITDYGSLPELTAGCQGVGMEDGAAKVGPFIHSQPDFGDPGFCT